MPDSEDLPQPATRVATQARPGAMAAVIGPCKPVAETPSRPPILQPTIFHQPWLLNIASDGTYREATVSSGGAVVGRLPYILFRKPSGHRVLGIPDLTHVLGPAITVENGASHATRSLRQFTITRDLIAQLPTASHVGFRLHQGITNTLAFEAAGFDTFVNYTVEIAPQPREVLWSQMRDKTRNVIRRAGERLTVVDLFDPERFIDFYERNLHERGLRNYHPRHLCVALVAECLRRGVGRILIAADPSGNYKSGVFTIWDHQQEYYFMSTRTRDSHNGATSLLIWAAIQHAAMQGLTFNTDGLDSRSNVMLLTGFGGTIKPRLTVEKSSMTYALIRDIKRRLTPLTADTRG